MVKRSRRLAEKKKAKLSSQGLTGSISASFSKLGSYIFNNSVDVVTKDKKNRRETTREGAGLRNTKSRSRSEQPRHRVSLKDKSPKASSPHIASNERKSSKTKRTPTARGGVAINNGKKLTKRLCNSARDAETSLEDNPWSQQYEMHTLARQWNSMSDNEKLPYVTAEKMDTMRYVGETMQYNMKKRERRETAIRNLKEDISKIGRQQIVERLKISGKKPRRKRL